MKRLLNIIDKDAIWDFIRACTIGTISATTAYFESTYTFIIALFIAFVGNILAGFEADEVKIKLKRIFPPVMLFENLSIGSSSLTVYPPLDSGSKHIVNAYISSNDVNSKVFELIVFLSGTGKQRSRMFIREL